MKHFSFKALAALALLLMGWQVQAQRVIGYVPSYGDQSIIQYDKITDIFYAFGDVSSTGVVTVQSPAKLQSIVSDATSNGVKVHLALGGAGNSDNFTSVAASETYRNKLADQCLAVINQYGLAGIDLDWEFPAGYQSWQFAEICRLIKEKIGTKELSVAVAALQYNSDAIGAQADPYIDYYNLMAYDNGGDNHSTYVFAQQSVSYWANDKGISKSRLRLGLPFYGRNAVKKYSEIAASNPSAAYNDADDYYNGSYYNAAPTIKQKCQYALDQGLDGVMIWELTQDRTDQYSLINAVDEIMDAGVVCQNPNLGFTKSLCGSPSVTLDPGVNASGFSYKWKKDGSYMTGETSQTLTVTNEGTYTVEFIDNSSTCPTKTSTVDVVSASAINVTDAERCGPGTVDLTINESGSYKWYGQASGGSQLGSGQTFKTPSISNTTTYYVEKPAVSETVGMAYDDSYAGNWAKGDASESHLNSLMFNVESEFTLDAVTIFYNADAPEDDVTITIYDKNDVVIGTTTYTLLDVGKQRVPVGIDLSAGTDYRINATGAAIWCDKLQSPDMFDYDSFDFSGIIDFTGTDSKWGVVQNWHAGFYDWEVSSGASCGRTSVKAIINTCSEPTVSFVEPSSNVLASTGNPIDLKISATDTDGSISAVTFTIKDESNNVEATLNGSALGGDQYGASWTPDTEGTYTVEVKAVDNDKLEATATNSFTITINKPLATTESLEQWGVNIYPNPVADQLNIELGDLSNANITLFSIQGTQVFTQKNVSGQLTIPTELPAGIYTLQVTAPEGTFQQKILKK